MSAVYMFPGQGSQEVGMGKNLYDKYESIRNIFNTANKVLGYDITDLMFNGPESVLNKTIHSQPAILVASAAYYSLLKEKVECTLVMGHSIGEYAALHAAKVFTLEESIELSKKRAEFMSKCRPQEDVKPGTSHMAAVMILDKKNKEDLYQVCKNESVSEDIVTVANINSSYQFVISGNNAAVIRVKEYMYQEFRARGIYVKVECPFHSEFMRPAADEMKKVLENYDIKEPVVPIIANITADIMRDPAEIKNNMVEQIPGKVRWMESIEKALETGHNNFIESGHGKILHGIARNIQKKDYPNLILLDKDKYLDE